MQTRTHDGALHFSALKLIGRSPLHYRTYLESGMAETAAMARGTLVHALVLGGEFVVYDGERRGNAWKCFEEDHLGQFICTRTELNKAQRVADAVLAHPLAAPLLVGDTERAWSATLYGRPCAGRIDVSGAGHTVDLKLARDTHPDRFKRACLGMAYHAQLSFYADARRALGELPGELYIVGVEPVAPYAVTVLRVTERAALEGRKLTRLWVEQLAACEAANEWPGYAQSIVDLDVVEDDALIFADDTDSDAAEAAQ